MPAAPLLNLSPKQFGAANAVVTGVAMGFLVWLVYFHEGNGDASRTASLPLINAILNGTSAVLICAGRLAIRAGLSTIKRQRRSYRY